MQKIFDFNAGTYVYVDDEPLFPKSAPAAITHRITCRVCDRPGLQAANGVTLCQTCAGLGADALRSHIATVKQGTYSALERASAELEADIAAADTALLARWNAFQDAIGRDAPEARNAELKARNGLAGPLADLIRRWCRRRDAMAQWQERCRWAESAELTIVLWQDEVL